MCLQLCLILLSLNFRLDLAEQQYNIWTNLWNLLLLIAKVFGFWVGF